ncbi:MAG: cell division protein FtsX [Actinomycetota bacterium]|jgi:cell division transport system permease protein|nr:MAG: cell division protein FtsX [Actinomycetota bacterium]
MSRLDAYFRETAAGLRRNGVVAFAAISTAFIALFLFGLALLIARQFDLVIDAWTENAQVAIYLEDPVKAETVGRLMDKLQSLPAVADVTFQDKDAACARFHEVFRNQPELTENVDCATTIPASLRVQLVDPARYQEIAAALGCAPNADSEIVCTEPGIAKVNDNRRLLDLLTAITRVLSIGVLSVALIMLVSAVFLIANTLRMGMFARRKEIGIMRLVGATNWRIRVPFLIEGLVESLLGAAAAIFTLFLLKVVFIDRLRGQTFLPLIGNDDVLVIAPWVLVAGVGVALIAGTIGIRRFLDV